MVAVRSGRSCLTTLAMASPVRFLNAVQRRPRAVDTMQCASRLLRGAMEQGPARRSVLAIRNAFSTCQRSWYLAITSGGGITVTEVGDKHLSPTSDCARRQLPHRGLRPASKDFDDRGIYRPLGMTALARASERVQGLLVASGHVGPSTVQMAPTSPDAHQGSHRFARLVLSLTMCCRCLGVTVSMSLPVAKRHAPMEMRCEITRAFTVRDPTMNPSPPLEFALRLAAESMPHPPPPPGAPTIASGEVVAC